MKLARIRIGKVWLIYSMEALIALLPFSLTPRLV